MRKLKYFLMLISFVFVMQSNISFSATHNCQNPELYLLSNDEVNMSNSEFYCWEIRYLKQYHNLLSTSMNSYYSFYAKNLDKDNIEVLRKLGVTPEKYDYLKKYFIDEDDDEEDDFKKVIEIAISRSKKTLTDKVEYKYGNPIFSVGSFLHPLHNTLETLKSIPSNIIPKKTVYDSFLKIFGQKCIPSYANNISKVINKYPSALQPVGVIGKYFVNAFGEVSLELNHVKENLFYPTYDIRLPNNEKSYGNWDTKYCSVSDFGRTMKRAFSCTPCTMFEIAFNTVSRVGFVLYDKLSRFAIELMIVLFSLWSLLMFFDNAIKKQDGFSYIKTFFSKIIWVFIVGAFLSVSIKDENNIVNYTIRPITDFMVGYSNVMTRAIDTTHSEWTCKYATRDLKDNKYLFSKDVKQDIVCTIERIADFNNLNILVGVSVMKQGFSQVMDIEIGSGVTKILLGLTIAGIFFIFNLSVPYYFIESLFHIALVVFLFPLFLMAYAFDKGKSFVKNGFDTFLSSISQIIALSIMCSVISLLMYYISSINFYDLQKAIETNNSQEVASSMLLFYSFNTNYLLEIIYTGIICWWLLSKSLEFANAFGSSHDELPKTFGKFMGSSVKAATSVVVDYAYMKMKASTLAEKLRKDKDKEAKNLQKAKNLANEILEKVGEKK